MTGRVPTIFAISLAALGISGCANQVALDDPALPEPLLNEMPLSVAVRYAPEMEDYSYEEEVLGREKWTIHLGAANKILFRHLFESMFREVTEVGPDVDPADIGADALIEASIEAFEFALPAQSRTDAYTVWIRYRLRVFDAEGTEISNWPISAYGKAASESYMGTGGAMKRAAILAMRDAAAMVGMRFARETGLGNPGGEAPAPSEASALANAEVTPGGGTAADAVESEPAAATTDRTESEGKPADVAANTNQGNFQDDRG